MKPAAALAAIASFASLVVACDRNGAERRGRDDQYRPPFEEPNYQQTAREESLDQQEPGVQAHGVPVAERELVAGQDEQTAQPLGQTRRNGPIRVPLQKAPGVTLEGDAELSQGEEGVTVVVNLRKASQGKHGVHIHEKGDCSDIKGESMGGHFAPEGDRHALPSEHPQSQRHLGDLGNIDVAANGTGKLEFKVEKATLVPGQPLSFFGRAIVVHEGRDVGAEKQPSGGSGTPIACAVIQG